MNSSKGSFRGESRASFRKPLQGQTLWTECAQPVPSLPFTLVHLESLNQFLKVQGLGGRHKGSKAQLQQFGISAHMNVEVLICVVK